MSASPVNLSREMKLVLALLGMVALIGAWFLFNSRKNDTAVTPPPVVAGQTTTGDTGTASSSNTTVDNVTPDGKVDVAVAPPLPVGESTDTTATTTPAPGGINPDQPLISLGSVNPFRPIKLDPVDPNSNAGSVQATANTPPATASAGPITISRPISTDSQINSALGSGSSTSGAMPLPTITGTSRSTPSGSPSTTATRNTSSGALPLPTIPGTTGGVKATGTGSKANTPVTTINVPKSSGGQATSGSKTQAGANTASSTTTAPAEMPAPAPVVPPVVGMSVPRVNTVPSAANSASNANASNAATGAATATQTSTTVATPANPQVVTETAQVKPVEVPASPASTPAATTPTPATPAPTPLEVALQEHNFDFNAVVLGPVNTAIFRSDKGFVVTSVGQTIPDTKIILKEVTATSATLSLGNETKTLQLEKR